MGAKKTIVYTAITGEKDEPRNDILCFKDYDRFKDPRLNAKIYKVLPHLFLDCDYSIWVDGNLHLNCPPDLFIQMLGGKEVGVFPNPYRENLKDEAEECKRLEMDSPEVIDEQVKAYGKIPNSLGACFLIVRKHTEKVAKLNEKWWAHITRYSVRDQISFPYVYRDVKYFHNVAPFENQYFKRHGHIKKK